MKSRLARIATGLAAAFSTVFAFSSCNENAIIRSGVAPAVDNINTFGLGPDYGNDSVTMYVRTVFDDSVVTSQRDARLPIYHGLGWVTDPFAGTTSAGIYLQVTPTITNFKFAANEVLDSLVLVMPYGGLTWGDTTRRASTTVRAYAISGGFPKETTYYNFDRLQTAPGQLGATTIVTGPKGSGVIQDSTAVRQMTNGVVRDVNRQAHLRIKIQDTSLLSTSFRAAIAADSTYAGFTAALPGFFIVPDTSGTGLAMPYFRLNSPQNSGILYDAAALVAYTHLTSRADSVIANQFVYNTDNGAHFNRIVRNYSGSPANSIIGNRDTVQQTVLMQNGPGATIEVMLPYVKNLPEDVLIIKAELKLTQVPAPGAQQFFGPNRLYPEGVNSAGARYIIADRYSYSQSGTQYDNTAFLDGNSELVTRNGMTVREYKINFPKELQRAIAQNSNRLHLRIGGTSNYPAAYRILFGGKGQSDATYRPSLNIIYSKQNK